MKRIFNILCLTGVLIFTGCSGPKIMPVKGAWKLVSIKYMVGDSVKWTKTAAPQKDNGIKMWSDNYFVCIYRFASDSVFDYSFSNGTYKLEGNKYEETVISHDQIKIPDMVGLKIMMRIDIKNDTLVQTYPVDENGNLLKKYTIVEKLVKLD